MWTEHEAQDIAACAARMIVEDGMDHGAAKRRAVQVLGLPARTRLPGNEVVDDAVREHIRLYCSDTQPGELAALRTQALVWMERLSDFRPHLAGAVWQGTATRLSDVYIQLFCDDSKSAELRLINQGVRYQAGRTQGFRGDVVDVLSLSNPCPDLGDDVVIHLVIYDADDLRGALKPDSQGRKPRGDAQAVRALLLSSPP